jgi:hypothetical protein
MFQFATNSKKVVLESYESKPSTEIRIENNGSYLDLKFFEDGIQVDLWPVKDFFFKDVNACCLRFPEIRCYLEGI